MPSKPILRRVKPDVFDDSEEEEEVKNQSDDESEQLDEDKVMGDYSDEDSDQQDDDDEEGEEEEGEEGEEGDYSNGDIDAKTILAETSFAVLAQAESSLFRNRNRSRTSTAKESSYTSKPSTSTTKANEDRISAIKSKLSELNLPPKSKKLPSNNPTTTARNPLSPNPQINQKSKSKSAPAEQSSKKPVSRFREAIETNIPKSRDPRFDSNSATPLDEAQFRKRYAFLDEYKEIEIAALKERIAKARGKGRGKGKGKKERNGQEVLGEKEVLEMEKLLKRMESQKQAQEAKDRSATLVAEHKKKERELVKEGKTPYFLKRSEQKKMVLMDKYSKLGEKELEHVLARRRKHKAAKEKRNMPWARRGTEP